MKQSSLAKMNRVLSRIEQTWQHTAAVSQEFFATGLPEIDGASGGLPRGGISEVCGKRSAGGSTIINSILSTAAESGEYVAIVDANDAFNPSGAQSRGLDVRRVFWIRCGGRLEVCLRAADFTLRAGCFGLVVLDLADVRDEIVRRIPLSHWYRFRLAVEHTPAILLIHTPVSCSGSACALSIEVVNPEFEWGGGEANPVLKELRRLTAIPGRLRRCAGNQARDYEPRRRRNGLPFTCAGPDGSGL